MKGEVDVSVNETGNEGYVAEIDNGWIVLERMFERVSWAYPANGFALDHNRLVALWLSGSTVEQASSEEDRGH